MFMQQVPLDVKEEPSLYTQALELARRGHRIFPVHSILDDECTCGDGCCQTPGRHPRIERARATTDMLQIAHWWNKYPSANIGVATGQGLLVFEVNPHLRDRDWLTKLKRLFPLEETLAACPGAGQGYQFYYTYPPALTINTVLDKLGRGITLHAEEGYVLAPPSKYLVQQGAECTVEYCAWTHDIFQGEHGGLPLTAPVALELLEVLCDMREARLAEEQRETALFERALALRHMSKWSKDEFVHQLLLFNSRICGATLSPLYVLDLANRLYEPPLVHKGEEHRAVNVISGEELRRSNLFDTPPEFIPLTAVQIKAQKMALTPEEIIPILMRAEGDLWMVFGKLNEALA